MLQPPAYTFQSTVQQPIEDWALVAPSANFRNPPETTQYLPAGNYVRHTPEPSRKDIPEPEEDLGQEGEEDQKNDPDLVAKFESLALDEDKDTYPAELHTATTLPPPSRLEPKRHASEIPRFESEWFRHPTNTRDRLSGHSAQTSVSSTISATSLVAPPGLPPPPHPMAPTTTHMYIPHQPYTSYSSNNLMQVPAAVPMYQVPTAYYLCQPTVVPVAVPYPCFAYPQPTYSKVDPPRRYFSSKQQPYVMAPVAPAPSQEVSDMALALIKDYEHTGDYKKLAGQIAKLARLQSGSRFLQKEVDKADRPFLTFVLHEVLLCISLFFLSHW